MAKQDEVRMTARAPRRDSKDHLAAVQETNKPDKYGAFHVRLTKDEVKKLKQKLLDMGLTGTQWLRKFINS